MLEPELNGLRLLRFPALTCFEGINHGVFSRHGGVSQGPLATLNVGTAVDDVPENVQKNRLAIASVLGARRLAFVQQVHGKDVAVLDSSMDTGSNTLWSTGLKADALVTDIPGVFCAMAVADCQPILLYDPTKKVVAAIHSGWKGSLLDIVGDTVLTMVDTFGSAPKDLVAGIGPSLGPCCAEFIHYQKEIPEQFWPYKDENNHFDFWAITRDQLVRAGVADKNVFCVEICTKCGPDDFYSYRKDHHTGRFAAVIGIRA